MNACMKAFCPGDLVRHRPSQQRMRIDRRVRTHFRDGGDAYWCTWRTTHGMSRRALYAADELERVPSADEPRAATSSPELFPAAVGYTGHTWNDPLISVDLGGVDYTASSSSYSGDSGDSGGSYVGGGGDFGGSGSSGEW